MNISQRLKYRELNADDFHLFSCLYSDENVMRYAYKDSFKTTEDAKEEFEKILNHQKDSTKGTHYVATLIEDETPVGIVDYDVVLKHEAGGIYEIGYFLKPQYWKHGYGFEMSQALIEFLFSNFNIHKIVATCNYRNEGSEKIMKKLGMQMEGQSRKSRFKNLTWDDELIYSILREEWEKLK